MAYVNGRLPSSALAPIAGGTYLRNDAAAAWNAMAAEIYKETGQRISINGSDSAYRTFDRQVYWKNYWCSRGACQNAATPGTSNHGWGIATDIPSYTADLIGRYGAKYGWRRECTDAPWESWHYKWCGGWSGKDPGPDYTDKPPNKYPTIKRGSKKHAAVKRAQKHLKRWNHGLTRPEPDGTFGDGTAKAVRQFQATHGLKPDGVVGKNTWRKLRSRHYLKDDELLWWNRLKLLRKQSHHTPKETKLMNHYHDNINTRAQAIREVALDNGWSGENRGKRYKMLRSVVDISDNKKGRR